jgi:hypothetical protein
VIDMNKMVRTSIILSFAVAAALTVPSVAEAADTFGAGVSLKEATPLDRLLTNPEALEGRTVRIEGVVTEVCSHMGCWMALAVKSDANAKTVLVKVDDGVIVFPVTARGRRAAAQGVVERVKADDHEAKSAAQEHAKAEKRESAGTAWQLKATGAIVY